MAHALSRLFGAKSVALVGASDNSPWSNLIFGNLVAYGFTGAVHMVNLRGAPAHGRPGVASCRDIGAPVDVAYIFVPAEAVADALADAGRAGIAFAIVLSSGFSEVGADGARAEARLVETARALGVTMMGPNSLGFLNMVESIAISPVPAFLPLLAPAVGVISQSGNTANTLSKYAYQQGVGLSYLMTTGNEAALDVAAIFDFLVDDEATKAIGLFIETIRDAKSFSAAAEKAFHAKKPVVIYKVGASPLTAEIARSHTGSLVGDDRIFNAVCRKYGMIRVESPEELINTAGLIAYTGPISRPGVAVVSMSGGACEMAAERAAKVGMPLPPFSGAALDELRASVSAIGATHNPLDITGAAVRDHTLFVKTLRSAARDPQIGITCCISGITGSDSSPLKAMLHGIGAGLRASSPPGVLLTEAAQPISEDERRILAEAGIGYAIAGIYDGICALGHLSRWSGRLSHAPRTEVAAPAARAGRPETERQTLEYLAGFGIPVIPAKVVQNLLEAQAAAGAWAGPTVLKILSPDIAHKTEVGGIRLNIADDRALAVAYQTMLASVRAARPDARIEGVIVSPMREGGIELLIGTARDPQWGVVIAVALGGVWVEALDDSAISLLPITREDALEMLASLRGRKLLQGFRGAPAADLTALADVIVKFGDAALALGPALVSLEINPMRVNGTEIEALDALAVFDPRHGDQTDGQMP